MRIDRNQKLKTLLGKTIRPTSFKVKEALFNIWQGKITGCSLLDLCAGSGAIGYEALYRGATLVVGIEKHGKACAVINTNWLKISSSEKSFKVIKGDALRILNSLEEQQFDFIYFDPPYRSNLYQPTLELIAIKNILAKSGEIAVEHDSRLWKAKEIKKLKIIRKKYYGDTNLTFYQPNLDS